MEKKQKKRKSIFFFLSATKQKYRYHKHKKIKIKKINKLPTSSKTQIKYRRLVQPKIKAKKNPKKKREKKSPNFFSHFLNYQTDSFNKKKNANPNHGLTAIASAILMVALVASRILCIRQPSFPMTFPICRDGTMILNITSWPFTRFAAESSASAAVPGASSSRRRLPDETGIPAAAASSWTEKGIWRGT